MDLQNVLENLNRTIAGKEAYLQALDEKADIGTYPATLAYRAVADYLVININELQRIKADVQACIKG